jgi:hypothetical protein
MSVHCQDCFGTFWLSAVQWQPRFWAPNCPPFLVACHAARQNNSHRESQVSNDARLRGYAVHWLNAEGERAIVRRRDALAQAGAGWQHHRMDSSSIMADRTCENA